MEVLILSEAQVDELLNYPALIDSLADGFMALSRGEFCAPDRTEVSLAKGGGVLTMPGRGPGTPVAVKLVSHRESNQALGLPSVHAAISLFDEETGELLAIMAGAHITGARTAAAAALSARLLAQPEASVFAILGAGVQARFHLELMTTLYEFQDIRIAARTLEDAERLASTHPSARALTSFEEAARGAHIISACTSSSVPILLRDWVDPGTHITSVNYAPPGGELDPQLFSAGRLFVEHHTAFAPAPAGCPDLSGVNPSFGTELGVALSEPKQGRRNQQDITVYRSMGHVMEDVVAAQLVYQEALRLGVGALVEI